MPWALEVIDGSAEGWWQQISVDGSGTPHVVYVTDGGDLKYGYRDGTGWHTETIAAINHYDHCAIAARDDQVHILWTTRVLTTGYSHPPHVSTGSTYTLHHGYKTVGGSWTYETLVTLAGPDPDYYGDSGWVISDPQIALDSDLAPHVVYTGARGYVARDEPTWSPPQVFDAFFESRLTYLDGSGGWAATDFGYISGTSVSSGATGAHKLAIDSGDVKHVTWSLATPNTTQNFLYANSAGGWTPTTIDTHGTYAGGGSTALAIGADDIPHLLYRINNTHLKHAYDDGGWAIDELTADGYEGALSVIAGICRASYSQYTAAGLLWSRRVGSAWVTETITGLSVGTIDQASTPAGAPSIIFTDYDNSQVMYAAAGVVGAQWVMW